MLPYYLNLNKRLISDELSETLLEIAKNHIDNFIDYKGQLTGRKDGNSFLSPFRNAFKNANLFNHSEIEELKNSCMLKFFPLFMMHRPNTKVDIHIDDPNNRNCVIITPLFPKINYIPTRFWKKNKTELVAVCNFDNFNSTLVNTQISHDLENIDSYRFNLQFCFKESMEEVAHLYETGQLFKN